MPYVKRHTRTITKGRQRKRVPVKGHHRQKKNHRTNELSRRMSEHRDFLVTASNTSIKKAETTVIKETTKNIIE